MDMENRDHLPPFSDHVKREARLVVCGEANDAEEAKTFFDMLGLVDNTEPSDSDNVISIIKEII